MRIQVHHFAAPSIRVLMGAALVLGGCASFTRSGPPGENATSLFVDNRTGDEVVVYGLPGSRSVGVRLGNVRSFSTATINVPKSALMDGTDLVVRLHAIGGERDWTSPRLTLSEDMVARLEIRADARGDMSRSAFYMAPPATSDLH